MNPQQNQPHDQFEETLLPPDLEEQPTQAFQPAEQPKKSHKRTIIMVMSSLIVIGGVLGAYFVYSQMSDDTASTKTTQPAPVPKAASPVDTAAGIMTEGTTSEDELTATDDSSDIDDASQVAGNVGDSINENNF